MIMIDNLWMIYKDIKPTKHKQICSLCNKQIEKGEERVCVLHDIFYNSTDKYIKIHKHCFCYAIYKKIGEGLTLSKKMKDRILVEEL